MCRANSKFPKSPGEKHAWSEKIYQYALDTPKFCEL